MKTRTLLSLSLIAFLWISFLQADRETLYVDLTQETPLENVYFSESTGYLNSLQEVLEFDFSHNGKTALDSSKARSQYEIALLQNASNLKCTVINLTSGQGKVFDGVELTMDLAKDRQAMHRLSDAIFKTLFKEEGIASTRFIYTRRKTHNDSTSYELIEADYDGKNPTILTRQKTALITPCIMGKECLFVSYTEGEPKLYTTSLKQFQPKRLSLLKGNQITPAVSQKKNRVAFVSDAKGNPDLYIAELDGQGNACIPRRIYGFPKAAQASPTFNPDGSKIAFVSNKDGFPRIYSLEIPDVEQKIKNLRPQLLTTLSKESTAPCWSPDGKKLAYCARDTNGVRQIYVYDFATKKERQLTSGPFNKENPSFGPNSFHLLFNTADDSENSLYLMNLRQKETYKLSSDTGENRFPSWG